MEQNEWEAAYAARSASDIPEPAVLLSRNTNLLTGGQALDIAMGCGQNAVFLAAHGYTVTGIDRSASATALAREHAHRHGVSIATVTSEIESFPIEPGGYDLIANFFFLDRNLFSRIITGLRPNGLLFFETYTRDQAQFGGPRNPDHLLGPNELLMACLDLLVIYYNERVEDKRAIASLIARKID